MPSWAKSSSAPATPKVSPRRHLAWAQESSGQVGQGCGRVPEMTWSFASPDGRVTFEIVTDDDEPWIRWRRVGESPRLQAPLITSRRSGRAASEGGCPTTLLWSGGNFSAKLPGDRSVRGWMLLTSASGHIAAVQLPFSWLRSMSSACASCGQSPSGHVRGHTLLRPVALTTCSMWSYSRRIHVVA